MIKDFGIVLLPNQECNDFANYMTKYVEQKLPLLTKSASVAHISLIHIANVNETTKAIIKDVLKLFTYNIESKCMTLLSSRINATGGDSNEGYKWLDIQFSITPPIIKLRNSVLEKFCPFHNATLTRMLDDIAKFNSTQIQEIEECSMVYSNFTPHITTWYINLPIELKEPQLQVIANELDFGINNLTCYTNHLALVELGRNGNVLNILEQYPMCRNQSDIAQEDFFEL